MRPVPVNDAGSPLVRTTAACLAAILELSAEEVPAPDYGDPWTVWRNWLGQRGLGLVPVADPSTFAWPGPWLALFGAAGDVQTTAAVAFGVPSDIVWQPLGEPRALEEIQAGYVIAAADVALWSPGRAESERTKGRVEAIVIAAEAGGSVQVVEEAQARAGRGLEGDRYAAGRGTFSNPHARGVDLTLIEIESVKALQEAGIALEPRDARRNIVTSGIDLNALVGKRFAVGDVECLGQRLCEPCAHLQRLTRPGTLRGLIHKGGLRADVLSDGAIRVGDAVSETQ